MDDWLTDCRSFMNWTVAGYERSKTSLICIALVQGGLVDVVVGKGNIFNGRCVEHLPVQHVKWWLTELLLCSYCSTNEQDLIEGRFRIVYESKSEILWVSSTELDFYRWCFHFPYHRLSLGCNMAFHSNHSRWLTSWFSNYLFYSLIKLLPPPLPSQLS